MSYENYAGPQHAGAYHFQMQDFTRSPPTVDKEAMERLTDTAFRKFRTLTMVGTVLGLLLVISGAATLGVAAPNPGFPTFNFGPLLSGLIMLIGYSIGLWNVSTALRSSSPRNHISSVKCSVIGVFVVSVANITFATLSAVFGLLSGLECSGVHIQWYQRYGNVQTPLDTEQYCHPNVKANAALAFVDVVLCAVVGLWCIFGMIYFCMFPRVYGIRNRRYGGSAF